MKNICFSIHFQCVLNISNKIYIMPLSSYLKIMRPNVCGLTVFALVVGGIVSGQIPATQILIGSGISWQPIIVVFAAVAAFLICGAGNTINDYFDYAIDAVNASHRPIPSGKISRQHALWFYIGLGAVGLVLSWFVSIWFFVIALFNFFVLSMYGWKLKRAFILKNLAVAWLGASSFLAGGMMTGLSFGVLLVSMVAISFLGTWSREIFKDVEDIGGDAKERVKTLATVLGAFRSSVVGYVLLMIALGSLFAPYFLLSMAVYSQIAYSIFALIVAGICISTFFAKDARSTQTRIKIAMYTVTLMFFVVAMV